MTAGLNYPVGVTVDIAENVYISEWTGGRVRKVSGGVISTIAGNGTCCFSGDGGAATSAALWGPFAIGVDGDGNLYVVDYWANRVRVVYGVASVPLDSDGDGYPDALEITLGKNPNVYCPVMRADVDGDGVVSILDLRAAAQVFGRSVPPAPSRYDQGAPSVRDGSVNILDLSMMGFQFAKHVSSCP